MKNIYIASCNKQGGIYRYTLENDGTLIFCEKTDIDQPMYLTLANNKIYALLREPFSNNNESGLISYALNADGSLGIASDIIPTKGIVSCHLTVDKEDAYCVNYLSGNVVKLPDTVITHSGKGPHPTRQTEPHTHYVCVTHDGYVLVTDLGIDQIFTYTKDMEYVSQTSVPSGHGARHLVFSEDKKYVYCANELASTVSVFEYNKGHLSLIDTLNALPDDFKGESTAAAIRAFKNKLYVSNRGHDSITVFDIDGASIKLDRFIPCGGKEPRDFDVFGDILISTNQSSDNITVIDLKTDKIIQTIDNIKSPLCVV